MAAQGVALIGFMGAGKTEVGRLLAGRLGLPFLDLDEKVMETAGQSIPEIFAREGERGFRALERRVLQEILDGPPVVLACGGGTPVQPGVIEALLSWGTVVYLEVSFPELARRVGAGSGRPLWDEGAYERFCERAPVYQRAQLAVCAERPPAEVADAILDAVEEM